METKQCTKCSEVKAVSEFYKQKKQRDGLAHQCKVCAKAYSAKYRKENIESCREKDRERYRDNKEYYAQKNKRWHIENADKKLAYNRNWYRENAGLRAAWQVKRHAAQKQRTPQWADMSAVAEFYVEAKRLEELTGIQFHVDHIVPLQGELVSGLHVPANLQLLPAHENLSKSNSFEVAA